MSFFNSISLVLLEIYHTYPLFCSALIFYTGWRLSYWLFITLHILTPNNVDNADFRRFKAGNHGLNVPDDIYHETGYIKNEKGYLLFHQKWAPLEEQPVMNVPYESTGDRSMRKRGSIVKEPKSTDTVIVICHGFGDHSGGFLSRLAISFARLGYSVVSIDYIGHGRSDGLHGLINSVDDIVVDVAHFIRTVTIRGESITSKNVFLYGESLGGAVTFKVCTTQDVRKSIKGIILMSPMIKISDKMKPPEVTLRRAHFLDEHSSIHSLSLSIAIINISSLFSSFKIIVRFLKLVRSFFPYAAIVPAPDLIDKCFKNTEMAKEARRDPIAYKKAPRLQSAVALMRCTDEIAAHMEDLRHPVLIIHGESDVVTAPELSQELYNRCSSIDKTLKIYPTCWHNLLVGEPEEVSKNIFQDVMDWINCHSRSITKLHQSEDDDEVTETCSSPF